MHMTQETCERRFVLRLLSEIVNPDLRKLCSDASDVILPANGGAMFTSYDASEGGHEGAIRIFLGVTFPRVLQNSSIR
jgi:hypothetical protein